ncbi:Laminin subunit alpha-2 [Varanus komodoensis]|nr:Laminin subunit alpha-2 [Varanus komodoensis]
MKRRIEEMPFDSTGLFYQKTDHKLKSIHGSCMTACCMELPQQKLLCDDIFQLLHKGAIQQLSNSEGLHGFYSRYFAVQKRDGGLRPILDLRNVNRRFLRFTVGSDIFEFNVLPLDWRLRPESSRSVINFIGAHLDSTQERAFLPLNHRDNLCKLIHRIRLNRTIPAVTIQRLLGHMAAAVAIVPYGNLALHRRSTHMCECTDGHLKNISYRMELSKVMYFADVNICFSLARFQNVDPVTLMITCAWSVANAEAAASKQVYQAYILSCVLYCILKLLHLLLGLFPAVLNLASNALIMTNATCGERGPEMYCKLVEHVSGQPVRNPQCRICDQHSRIPNLRHPITNAIDGKNTWWQSPSIQNGKEYHYVTITLDLRQKSSREMKKDGRFDRDTRKYKVTRMSDNESDRKRAAYEVFQIAYVIVKAANSPRPGNWILERSLDGVNYQPWQYYAITDTECLTRYNISPRTGPPSYAKDDEVICTSYYSKIHPLENGECGFNGHSRQLLFEKWKLVPFYPLLQAANCLGLALLFGVVTSMNIAVKDIMGHFVKGLAEIQVNHIYCIPSIWPSRNLVIEFHKIHTSLINGRPSADDPSPALLEFTSARYIRLRFQRIRTLNADLMMLAHRDLIDIDPIVTRRYYYSIKDISVGGMCICYGHAKACPLNPATNRSSCECEHNTCGESCDRCCPGFNQKPWQAGTFLVKHECEERPAPADSVSQYQSEPALDESSSRTPMGPNLPACGIEAEARREGGDLEMGSLLDGECRPPEDVDLRASCNCHGKTEECYYDQAVADRKQSLNIHGQYIGGGVCINCTQNTAGINCETCIDGYFRLKGVLPGDPHPCRQCHCYSIGSLDGTCVKDEKHASGDLLPGFCHCKPGFGGERCDRCALGYKGFPHCVPCNCSLKGSLNDDPCQGPCRCKDYVEGQNCDQCKPGFFNLQQDNPQGCEPCFCSGITRNCVGSRWTYSTVRKRKFIVYALPIGDMNGWYLTDVLGRARIMPQQDSFDGPQQLSINNMAARSVFQQMYYWSAPSPYLGNKVYNDTGGLPLTSLEDFRKLYFRIRDSAEVHLCCLSDGFFLIWRYC